MIPILLLSTVLIGIIAGSYPAFVLASFRPLRVLYGDTRTGKGGFTLRKILVVLQFSISIALIISTLVVYARWKNLSNRDQSDQRSVLRLVPGRLSNTSL